VRRQALKPGSRRETAGRTRAAERPKRKPMADCRAERFDGEPQGGYRVNSSRRSASGAVCSPNPAALRARSAYIAMILLEKWNDCNKKGKFECAQKLDAFQNSLFVKYFCDGTLLFDCPLLSGGKWGLSAFSHCLGGCA
jgi:hypothetical protein